MAFDSENKYSSRTRGTFQERLLANIRVPWKLNFVILVMVLGIVGVFYTALIGVNAIRNQQEAIITSVTSPIIALNKAIISLDTIQAELDLLKNPALSPAEKASHFEVITKSDNEITLILQNYETNWLAQKDTGIDAGFNQTRKLEIQKTLDTLQSNKISIFGNINNIYSMYNNDSDILFQNIKIGKYRDTAFEHIYNTISSLQPPLRQLISIQLEELQLADESSRSLNQNIIARMLFALVIAIGIGVLFSYTISRSISSRLDHLGNDVLNLQYDLLDRREVVSIEGSDEFALVARSFRVTSNRLREIFSNLENTVNERTSNLVAATAESIRRAKQFESITKVARAITTSQKLLELLPLIANVISEQFDFYHVGIYLNDTANQVTILGASNSEGGKKMLERSHQLKIGEQGIVGIVTQTGKARIALDVGNDAFFFNNPELPLTHSEVALPLAIGNQVFGALDIQSTEVAAFIDDDLEILTALADLVGLAIQTARLFDQSKKSLAESESIQRQYIRETWSRLPKEEKLSGFRYSIAGAVQLNDETEIVENEEMQNKREIKVPIVLRGETIGTLYVQVPKSNRVSPDQIDLINAVAERVGLSAENARLFEESNRRAERERIISNISSKIGTSVRTESILRTTAIELGQFLEDADIFINLQSPNKEN